MKEKLTSFLDRNGGGLIAFGAVVFMVLMLWTQGILDSIYYVRRSPVTETVTFKEDSNIRPIFVSWTPSDEEQASKIAPFLKSIDESPSTAKELVLGNGVVGKSIMTLTYGMRGISKGLFVGLGEQGYFYLYNKDTNTYKGYNVAYFKFFSNQGELNKELQTKYGSAYSVLPWKYKIDRTLEVGYLENGKVEVYLTENYSVENQAEIDKAYEDAPKAE
jgi:hypothetical protein